MQHLHFRLIRVKQVVQRAVIAAINELFSQQKSKDAARNSVATALATEAPTLSLPAIENQLRAVQDRQMERMRFAYDATSVSRTGQK